MNYNENDSQKNNLNLITKNIYHLNSLQYPNQYKQNIVNNNNINVNKSKNKPEEKIIEGELNFNENNKIHHKKIQNNNTQNKKKRKFPKKSPINIPKDKSSNLFPYQKLYINKNYYIQNSNINKPNSVYPQNGNILQPSYIDIGIDSNYTSSKTYNTFNKFKKNLKRAHSPLLKTSGTNNGINFVQKGVIKSRFISKSPILSKGSIFNKYKMLGLNGISKNGKINSNSNNQKYKKKTPIKNNQKKIFYHHQNNLYNSNNLKNKGQILIKGEIIQENNGKFNLYMNNAQNMQYNNGIVNLVPVYNSQKLKIESNNIRLNIKGQPNKNKEINENNNPNNDNNFKNNINNNIIQDINNDNKINENKKEENKKSNQRSFSQDQIHPLKKDETQNEKTKEKESSKIGKESNLVIKKIKDILPYSHVGFDGEEPKENNQDIYFIYKNFMGNKDYIYMSVCDGHGVEGHFVSNFIKETLPHDMSENLKNIDILKETQKTHLIITQTFLKANEKLVDNEDINSLFSGSTCVSVIYTPERLIVPNIGDSRAVLGRLNKENGEYIAIDLSRDHKPTEKDEEKRIIENDGRIQPFIEDGEFVGPQRVWIKEEEVPGLAMTRSFGDRVAATVGVISEPEIKEFNFCEEDKFMIIASDGIWEFISSQECVSIIKDFYEKNDLKGCCEYLYQESSKRWLKEEEVIDDTTLILVFFE